MAAYMVALTGGIASGKSEVERRFAALGVPVIDADLIARELVEPRQAALQEIVDTFGASMLNANGSLDRTAMRSLVFGNQAARERLEMILHPRIREQMQARAIDAEGNYSLLSIPLLVESGAAYGWINRVLVVDAPRALQLQRLLQRNGIDAAMAEAILAAQTTREQRLAIADDVIDNSGPITALDDMVLYLHQHYQSLARSQP
ncbi:MAG: dephospho-CoA kinase [Dokdonella sp.]